MTIREFFESKEKLAIHCNTEEQAIKLLRAFDRNNYQWCSGEKYIEKTLWYYYGKASCYDNERAYGHIGLYRDFNYKILEFEDIEIIEPSIDLSQVATEELLEEIKRRIEK